MKYDALVTRVRQEAPNISTIFFTIDGRPLSYVAGQYITAYFEETGFKPGKAYSLSSAPADAEMSITVKNVGQFSGLLCALKPGDHFQISSPYGFFNCNDDLPIVAIAAGVGLAPIWSIIRTELAANKQRNVSLYLTAPTASELTFRPYVDELFADSVAAHATYFVTRESAIDAQPRRFVVKDDVSKVALGGARFYVCGSQDFVRAMWVQLMEAGVDELRVSTETFYESAL